MSLTSVVCVLAACALCRAQYVPPSPCPDLFTYQSDGQQTYGVIRYTPSGGMSSITLKTNFSVKAVLPSNYVGRLEVLGRKQAVLQAVLRGEPLLYRVHFPITSPLPRLTAISVNGRVNCFGEADFAGPGEAVTSISLNHMLYAEGDPSGPGSFNQPDQTQPVYTDNIPNRNPTVIFERPPVEINSNNFNFEDSNEPSYAINTITVPIGNNNQNPQFVQQVFNNNNNNNNNINGFNTQNNGQVQPSPPRAPAPTPAQQPTTQPRPSVPQTPAPTSFPATECGVPSGGNVGVPLVYQGTSVSRGDWPWLTAVYVKRGSGVQYICTGSLVSNNHVVTAAHCMHEKSTILAMSLFVVKTGAYNLDAWSDAVIRGLKAAIIHPSYNAVTLENDILLMALDTSVQFTNFISPVCLWEGATDASFIAGQYGSVVGWGLNEIRGSGQGEPRMASIPVVTTDTCRASRIEFHKLTSKNTICAGDRNGTGPCNGDSGGGLYMLWGGRWRLRGVVSVALRPVTGEARCNLDEYVVFTDVAQYLPWLRHHMRE